jgi:hypothetical protein
MQKITVEATKWKNSNNIEMLVLKRFCLLHFYEKYLIEMGWQIVLFNLRMN